MIRPIRAETERYGEYSKPGEFVYDHPFQWGSRRIGPDLAREGGKYPNLWHVRHMEDPRAITAKSIMPAYPRLLDRTSSTSPASSARRRDGDARRAVRRRREPRAADGARAGRLDRPGHRRQGGPKGLEDKQIVALVAYLQRLGRDIEGTAGGEEHAMKSLTDVVSGAGLSGYAEMALVLFLVALHRRRDLARSRRASGARTSACAGSRSTRTAPTVTLDRRRSAIPRFARE